MRLLTAVLFILLATAPARAAPCEGWETKAFWKTTTPAGVAGCLATSAEKARSPLDKNGTTPLHLAAGSNATPAVVAALLAAGADGSLVDKDGKKPVDHAGKNEALAGTAVFWRLNDAAYGD